MTNVSPKVKYATLASALVTCLVAVAGAAGVEVPVEVQGAVITLLVAVAGWYVSDPRRS